MHGSGTAVGVRGGLWEWQVWGQRGENRGKEVVVGRARPPTCVCYVISHKSCRMPTSVGPAVVVVVSGVVSAPAGLLVLPALAPARLLVVVVAIEEVAHLSEHALILSLLLQALEYSCVVCHGKRVQMLRGCGLT